MHRVRNVHRGVAQNSHLSAVVGVRPRSFLVVGKRRRAVADPRLGRCVSGRGEHKFTGVGRFRVRCCRHVTVSFTTFVLAAVNISLSSEGVGKKVKLRLKMKLTLDFSCVLFRAISTAFTIGKGAPPVVTM